MARVRSTARVTRDREEAEATETAPISEVMKNSELVVTEGTFEEDVHTSEAEELILRKKMLMKRKTTTL
jgi:hypothetical protein